MTQIMFQMLLKKLLSLHIRKRQVFKKEPLFGESDLSRLDGNILNKIRGAISHYWKLNYCLMLHQIGPRMLRFLSKLDKGDSPKRGSFFKCLSYLPTQRNKSIFIAFET